jgi:hypothetical protein
MPDAVFYKAVGGDPDFLPILEYRPELDFTPSYTSANNVSDPGGPRAGALEPGSRPG